MTLSFTGRKRLRKYFGHMVEVAEMPNLIEVQKTSYDHFLQVDKPEGGRVEVGLEAVFKSVFPISDFRENSSLEFIEYSIGNWECKCGKLSGLHHLRKPCKSCGATLVADPYGDHEVLCPRCGVANQEGSRTRSNVSPTKQSVTWSVRRAVSRRAQNRLRRTRRPATVWTSAWQIRKPGWMAEM